ncbi:hypothetical protein, partial [Mesorhizobium sp. M7A.F.Ca.CA.001.14.1.1]|uniref:hypothetical protein n=1 Tax=Mesorhizobium sp. M7A.F.Ca.CA.001.14.1.1 TaxID=2496706 RepID=UPI0019D4BCE0
DRSWTFPVVLHSTVTDVVSNVVSAEMPEPTVVPAPLAIAEHASAPDICNVDAAANASNETPAN